MSKHGTPYGRLLRAVDSGNEVLILSAARELPRVALNDALWQVPRLPCTGQNENSVHK